MQEKWSRGPQILKIFTGGHAPDPTRNLTSSALENISSKLLPGTWHLWFLASNPSHARVPSIDAVSFSSEINIVILLTGSFPQRPLKSTAHDLPKISWNLLLQLPNKRFPFFKLWKTRLKKAQKWQRLLWILTFTWGRQINRCHVYVLNAMWTTSLTWAEVAGYRRTLPVGVHS